MKNRTDKILSLLFAVSVIGYFLLFFVLQDVSFPPREFVFLWYAAPVIPAFCFQLLPEHKAEMGGCAARCSADRLVSAVPDPDVHQHRLGRPWLGYLPGPVRCPGGGVRPGLGGIWFSSTLQAG